MSRNYAQIFTAIWRDPDFVTLSRPRQQAYFLLVTQPNISAAGALPLTVRRWAKLSADTTTAELLADIEHLHRVGMVVVDEDTEELLVRSFVRHDNGYRNPRRQPSIRDAAADIESPALRRVLARELVRLECPGWLPEMADVDLSAEQQPAAPPPDAFPQVNSHSDSHSDSQKDIDGMANRFQTARTPTPNPQPPTPCSAADAAPLDDGLFATAATEQPPKGSPPPKKPTGTETIDQQANRLSRTYADVVKLCNFPAIRSIVKKAISSGDYTEDEITGGLAALAKERDTVTTNTLRFAIEGLPKRMTERHMNVPYQPQRVNRDEPGSHMAAWNRRRAQHAQHQ